MDNTGDESREGASRFSPAKRQIIKQSGMADNGGEYVFMDKSKKQKLRRLSIVGGVSSRKEGSEMGFVGSDGEDEIHHTTSTSKRLKVPRKLFDDCNPVDHASVPRKLRSAMKKRNHESGSPPLPDKKKPNFGVNGVELPTKDAINRTKPNQQQDLEGSSSLKIVGPITKDEEEVVETLYALAVMFPFSNNNKKNLDCKLANAKSSTLLQEESSMPVLEDSTAPEKEEDSMPLCPSTIPVAVDPSLLEGSALETAKVKYLIEPSKLGLPNSAESYTKLDCIISQSNVQSVPLSSENKPFDDKLFCSSVDCNVQSELSLGSGCRQPKHEKAAAYAGAPAAAVGCQHELQNNLKESKKGSALWPGLSSAGSPGAGTQGPSLQSCDSNKPATRAGLLDTGVLTEKDSRGSVTRKNSWKRCSAHVYVSYLIKDLQNAERKDILPVQPTRLTPNGGTNQGVHLVANNMNNTQNGLNGAFSAADKNSTQVRNAILLHKRLIQDQLQASTSSALYTKQKQSFDFLPLSAVCDRVEATYTAINNNKVGNGIEPLTSFHIPYLQPLAQNQSVLQSFCLPQNRFSSSPFADNLPAEAAKQVQMQPSPYIGSQLLGPPHLDTSSSQKQQHQIWTAQLGPQYKPMGVAAESHIPNWQNGRQDPSAINHAQSILQLSHSSLEVLGPRHATFLQQQQYIPVTTSSLPTARLKRQHNYFLPSGFHGNGVGPSPDNTSTAFPLQFPLPLGQSVTYTL